MRRVQFIGGVALVLLLFFSAFVWFLGSENPVTPAGYVGYLTQGALFGQAKFYGLQTGPTSPGRTWMLKVTNVSVTPYTYSEDFTKETNKEVLTKDNLNVSFSVHVIFKVKPDRVRQFVDEFSYLKGNDTVEDIVKVAYGNFVQEPLRTYSRDEVQKHEGLKVKDNITPIGDAILQRLKILTDPTPFEISGVVVGNIQYPPEVTDAASKKLAATQTLEEKTTEILIEGKDKQKRIIQAEGIAEAMRIINARLTGTYLQHEAIEAQKLMVGSPNHTTIYLPVGPMGVPIVGTLDMDGSKQSISETAKKD